MTICDGEAEVCTAELMSAYLFRHGCGIFVYVSLVGDYSHSGKFWPSACSMVVEVYAFAEQTKADGYVT